MSDHDKKCEVILWKNNLWSACWCHERALEAELAEIKARLADLEKQLESKPDYDSRLADIASIAHDGGLRRLDDADALILVRRLTLPHWNKTGSHADARGRLDVAMRPADSAAGETVK